MDVLRGYAMVFVVLGHGLIGLISAKIPGVEGWGRSGVIFIYLFHIPILFLVSGFVSRDRQKSVRVFLVYTVKWIVAPYIIWSIILVLIQNVIPSGANTPIRLSALFGLLWTPITLFWFLYVLFLVKVSDYVVGRIVKEPIKAALYLIMIGAVGFEVGEMLNQPASLLRKTMCCLFFYGLGRLASERRNLLDAVMERLERHRFAGAIAWACGVAALALVAFLYSNKPDEKLQLLSEPQGWILVTGTLGIAICLIVARRTEPLMMGCWIKRIGMYSMVIYVQHTIWGAAIRSLLMRAGITHPALLIVAIVAGGILFPILWQKIFDSRQLTRFFGIRAVTLP
jgi:fucose 4-O-acetylase-like acetyltransferase